MTKTKSNVDGLLGFFDQSVLAAYLTQPDKYVVTTDNFEGEVALTDEYWSRLEKGGRRDGAISIRFGYRTLSDGRLALVVFLPDLYQRSKGHIARWKAFELSAPEWMEGYDERFDLWKRRYLEGDWDVDNGPRVRLEEVVREINALTSEALGLPLFRHQSNPALTFPAAENTHRYQDAHKELYGYIIDGIDKTCLTAIATLSGLRIQTSSDKTIKALEKALPSFPATSCLWAAFDTISAARCLAGHSVRPPATAFSAFETFRGDLEVLIEGLKELHEHLEASFGMDGEVAMKRQEAKRMLPKIVRP